MKKLIIIPTYNEKKNIVLLLKLIIGNNYELPMAA